MRKHGICVCLAALAALASVSIGVAGEKPATKSKPDVVIYDGIYPGWPWIAAGKDGTLFCVIREGTEHGFSAAGKCLFTKSVDGGRTWSPVSVIVDEPGIDDRNVAIVELPNGHLLVTYNTYARNPQTKKYISQVMTIRSVDGGQTWEKPSPGPSKNSQSKSAAVVLQNGSIIWPYYIAPRSGAVAAISNDLGKTWEAIAIPESSEFTGDEWDLVEVSPGHLIGVFRNGNRNAPPALYIGESKDSGRTWTVPKRTNLTTQMFAPGQIFQQGKNKTLTVLYPDRRMVSISAARPLNGDLTKWDVENLLPCYLYNQDEKRIPDGSYAVSAPIGPNRRLIVDYEIRPESKRITGYFVDFPENW